MKILKTTQSPPPTRAAKPRPTAAPASTVTPQKAGWGPSLGKAVEVNRVAFEPRALTSPTSVRFMGALAQAAYLDARQFNSNETRARFGFTQTRFWDASNNANARHAQAGVGVVPGVGIFIAYRGSESATDWARDLTAARVPPGNLGKDGQVHKGFATQTNDLWRDISGGVRELIRENPGVPVYFVGHSLGGAVARLASSRVMNNLEDGSVPEGKLSSIGGVFTFGAPAVGDAEFEKQWVNRLASHGGTYVRVRNDNDPVPLLPAVNFRHASSGVEDIHLRNDGSTQLKNDFGGGAVRRVLRAAGAIAQATDHLMSNYLSAIDAWSAKASREAPNSTNGRTADGD